MRPPESWKHARLTLVIAAVTAAAWLLVTLLAGAVGGEVPLDLRAAIWGGFIPARIGLEEGGLLLAPIALTPLTALFVHANFVHLAFNLLMLLFCGRAVENLIGGRGLLILYLVGAYAAAAAHYLADPRELAPMIGASGAISAVLGAYAILFGRNRVRVAHPVAAMWLHALWLAAAWIGLQLVIGFTFRAESGGIAIWAHIGGFLAGLLLAKPLLLLRYRNA